MRAERIGGSGTGPASVLRALAAATERRGAAPPAALSGDWFGARAVLAPSVAVAPVAPSDVFDVEAAGPNEHVGGGWVGYLSYPDGALPRIPVAAGGWTDDVLRLDAAGSWWYESLSGASLPGWIADALNAPAPAPAGAWHARWRSPDRDALRTAVLAGLEALAAGEVYQAFVCPQFEGPPAGR